MLTERPTCSFYDEIAAYVDGELSAEQTLKFENHLSSCRPCFEEVEQQKLFLRELESGLMADSEIELPADFAKVIVTRAESSVEGLRQPRELFHSVFICAGLFLFVLFAAGTETSDVLGSAASVFTRVGAVLDVLAHTVYSIFLGIAIVIRTASTFVRSDMYLVPLSALVLFGSLLGLRRMMGHFRRA